MNKLAIDYPTDAHMKPADINNVTWCYISGIPDDRKVEFKDSSIAYFKFEAIGINGFAIEE